MASNRMVVMESPKLEMEQASGEAADSRASDSSSINSRRSILKHQRDQKQQSATRSRPAVRRHQHDVVQTKILRRSNSNRSLKTAISPSQLLQRSHSETNMLQHQSRGRVSERREQSNFFRPRSRSLSQERRGNNEGRRRLSLSSTPGAGFTRLQLRHKKTVVASPGDDDASSNEKSSSAPIKRKDLLFTEGYIESLEGQASQVVQEGQEQLLYDSPSSTMSCLHNLTRTLMLLQGACLGLEASIVKEQARMARKEKEWEQEQLMKEDIQSVLTNSSRLTLSSGSEEENVISSEMENLFAFDTRKQLIYWEIRLQNKRLQLLELEREQTSASVGRNDVFLDLIHTHRRLAQLWALYCCDNHHRATINSKMDDEDCTRQHLQQALNVCLGISSPHERAFQEYQTWRLKARLLQVRQQPLQGELKECPDDAITALHKAQEILLALEQLYQAELHLEQITITSSDGSALRSNVIGSSTKTIASDVPESMTLSTTTPHSSRKRRLYFHQEQCSIHWVMATLYAQQAAEDANSPTQPNGSKTQQNQALWKAIEILERCIQTHVPELQREQTSMSNVEYEEIRAPIYGKLGMYFLQAGRPEEASSYLLRALEWSWNLYSKSKSTKVKRICQGLFKALEEAQAQADDEKTFCIGRGGARRRPSKSFQSWQDQKRKSNSDVAPSCSACCWVFPCFKQHKNLLEPL